MIPSSFQSQLATSLPALPPGPSLDDVRGPIEETGGFGTGQLALVALAILLIAALFVWLYRRSREQPHAPIDPYAVAIAELEAATQASDDERFAMLCANALRRLIASRFDLPAASQTSAELCARLPLPKEATVHISEFLQRCDNVKFARQALDPGRRNKLLNSAKELICMLKEEEAPAA